ncbi:hypothetical protein NZD89_06130 [Alicyclobacillus fastidiosus]|uniref:Uncharacterized protein n=1 Tax=Alicyclobacillus fastidiosus TaxID=392011 RepID=A0ABY6ZJH8_9BACL|nr:hypothetical protein [Alicyclobacillus fastidiosus]WAH42991.1 hypothetical protein NZD89_06130 [Alicyclobacillus fastidiosus]GMA64961.1 hypothetical protein GCM10025859_54010 [Alicyclobacillus fastidiosus]
MDEQLQQMEKRMNERFDRMEKMVADLIGVVGKTNAMVSDVKQEMSNMRSDIKGMEGAAALVDKRLDWQSAKIGQLEEKVAVK